MKKKIIFAFLIIIVIITSGIVYLNKVFLPVKIKSLIIRGLEEQTHKKVSLEALEFNIFKGLVLRNLNLYDEENNLLSIREASSRFFIFPIFRKQVIIPGIRIKSAVIFLERRKDGSFNIMDLFAQNQAPKKPGFNILIQKIVITNSRIDFQDDTLNPKFRKSLDNFNLALYLSLPASVKFNLKAEIKEETPAKIQARGEFKIPRQQLTSQVSLKNFSPASFAPYYSAAGFSCGGGTLDANAAIAFKDNVIDADFTTQGKGLLIAKDEIRYTLNPDLRLALKYNLQTLALQYSGAANIINSSLSGIKQIGPIEGVSGQIKFDNAGLSCDKISANVLGMPLDAEIQITDFKNPLLSVKAVSAPDLSYARGILKDKFNLVIPAQLEGKGKLYLAIKAPLSLTGAPEINGSLEVSNASAQIERIKNPIQEITGRLEFTQNTVKWQDLNFKYQDIAYKTTGTLTNFASPGVQWELSSRDLSLESAFNLKDKLITISRLRGRYANSEFLLAGTVDNSAPEALNAVLDGTLDIDLKDLKTIFKDFSGKLDAIKPEGVVHAKLGVNGNLNDLKGCALGIAFSAPSVSLYGLKATDFFLNYNQANGLAEIPLAHLSLYDGSLEVTGKLNLDSKGLPYWINANMQGVKIEKLKLDSGAKDKDIAGTIQAEAKINGFSNDLSRINGAGKILISDGKLWELNLFKGFGQLLFARDFSRIIFKEGYAGFIIQDKYIATDDLRLKSDLTDLTGSCKIGFDGSLDASINVEVLDELAPLSGTFKDVATAIIGRAGKFGSLKITGTLKEPKYKFKPAVLDILNSLKDTLLKSIQKQ